jgi:HTH-type transcriptional regulator / antitoxin HigA
MVTQVTNEKDYKETVATIETYLQKATQGGGFESLSQAEANELHRLSVMAEAYEDSIPLMPIRQPKTLVEMIELKMYQRKLKQKDLAKLLAIPESRLSEVLKGKRKVNLDLAKRLHDRLQIDATFILQKA